VERKSVWLETAEESAYPNLRGRISADVAVVGAGIVGVTTAILLKEAGRSVALVESNAIGRGVTGHSTAKVTSLHTLIYANLLERHGEDAARAYADANERAIVVMRERCARSAIDCDWADVTAYTFADHDVERTAVEREADAALRLGLPARFVEQVPLPFAVSGAVAFANQARFHPLRYLLSVAAGIPGGGSHVFENSRVNAVDKDGERHLVRTDGGEILAEDVIIATGIPFLNRGLFFARVAAHRAYALAAEAPRSGAPPGLFVSATRPTHSVRPAELEGRAIVVVSGEGHPVGDADDHAAHARQLESWARESLGAGRVLYRWSTQDYFPLDGLPFVGTMQRRARVYTATGFGGWGITNGTAAAMLLSDLLLDRENPLAELYDPHRLDVRKLPAFAHKGAHDLARLVGDRIRPGDRMSPSDVAAGDGRLIELEGETLAVSRDEEGTLRAVAAVCTHLGCQVRFNDEAKSWDCPCHGSRFALDGAVIQGPALEPLKDGSARLSGPFPADSDGPGGGA
jgi:glycine/D-amino acid oxidase-like deaminating enzyme/nitrite reductase/ring-hydroxylating ferredoxin subunit